jgi:Ca2+-binding RTX toxin-like protein
MALLRFYDAAPISLRLEQIFTTMVGPIGFGTEGALDSAKLTIGTGAASLSVTYVGSLAAGSGDVYHLRVEEGAAPWIVFADVLPPVPLFSYGAGLEAFQTSGAAAAAIAMNGSDTLKGSSHADYLEAFAGNDTIDAGLGTDVLDGGIGDDFLDGGAGIDTMIGGMGNDVYVVDDPFDLVVETEGFGTDSLFSSASYVLPNGVSIEVMSASGTAAISLTGNSQPDVIVGNVAGNVLHGLSGNDTLFGDGGDDAAFGDDGADTVYGGMGNDRLGGGAGNDYLYGDVDNDTMTGDQGNDFLFGGTGADKLLGGSDNDRLYGDTGNDLLSGDAGNDTVFGGLGNNTLRGGAGNDRVYGSENRDILYGDAGNDRLYGDAGDDRLDGGSGNDTLSGGPGRDRFLLAARPTKTNFDSIADFDVRRDFIELENSAFTKIGARGVLKSDAFVIGAAQDAEDRILYNASTGVLSYDPDGIGALAPIAIARLTKYLHLTAGDFLVV